MRAMVRACDSENNGGSNGEGCSVGDEMMVTRYTEIRFAEVRAGVFREVAFLINKFRLTVIPSFLVTWFPTRSLLKKG